MRSVFYCILSASAACVAVLAAPKAPSFFATRTEFWDASGTTANIGDFNGDGIGDVALSQDGGFKVFISNGDGTFAPPVATQNLGGTFIATGDLNSDGKLDVVGGFSGGLGVGLGNGDGTFQASPEYVIADAAGSVAIGDLNGDGKPDIAFATTSGFAVLFNQGNGIFGSEVAFPLGTKGGAIALADVNRDGHLDVAVGTATGITIMLGNGAGSFTTGQTFTLPYSVGSIVFGDIDRDGFVDMAASAGMFTYGRQVSLFYGSGSGQLGSLVAIPFKSGALGVAIGDANHDDLPDLIVISGNGVSVVMNKGNRSFAAPVNYSLATLPVALAVGPMRKSGLLDIVTANAFSFTAPYLKNAGNGTYLNDVITPLTSYPTRPAFGDFNGDGLQDMAAADASGIELFLNTGSKRVPFQHLTTIADPALSVVTGDFNNDGKPDLAATLSNGNINVYLGLGGGMFSAPITTTTGVTVICCYPYLPFTGDFNNDGKLDVVTSYNQILLGNGQGGFSAPRPVDPNLFFYFGWTIPADLNGDGKLDLAVVTNEGLEEIITYLGVGDGTFKQKFKTTTDPSGSLPNNIALGDLNGDGIPDLVQASGGEYVSIYPGNGDGTFGALKSVKSSALGGVGVVIDDFNGDGIQDMAVSNSDINNIDVLLGNGDFTFQPDLFYGTAGNPTWVASTHLQGTKSTLPDLVTSTDSGLGVLLNTTK